MSNRSLVGILIFLSILFLSALAGLFIFRQIERRAQINFGQEMVTQALREIQELKEVGFAEQDEAVRSLRSRAKLSQHKISELENNWHLFNQKRTLKNLDTKKLARLIQLNKKMINSYAQDINEYQKLGLPQNHKVISFAQDSIVRLAITLTDLKKQQIAIEKGECVSTQQIDRIKRMIAVNKQSIDHHKTLLSYYTKQDSISSKKVQRAKKQITKKVNTINALEKLLE